MQNVFAFCNQKGGVGKTTSVINLSTALGQKGYKVLILDMDAQANATSGLGEEKPPLEKTTFQLLVEESDTAELVKSTQWQNLSIIRSSPELSGAELELINMEKREFQLQARLETLRKEFDIIVIDCPPSLGLLTVNCLVASDYAIIPLQCEYYALEGLGQLLHTYKLVQTKLNSGLDIGAVILTMADLRTNLTQQVIEEVRNYFKEKVFETIVPRSVKLSEAPSFGKPAIVYDVGSRGVQAYLKIADEFETRFLKEEYRKETMEEQTVEEGLASEKKSGGINNDSGKKEPENKGEQS